MKEIPLSIEQLRLRDQDLDIISNADSLLKDESGLYLVTTGSYSVDALTGRRLPTHKDIDVNVFTSDIKIHRERTKILLAGSNDFDFRLFIDEQDRLEYDVKQRLGGNSPRRFEIQFIRYRQVNDISNHQVDFVLAAEREVKVPTVLATTYDSKNTAHNLRVKSLPYAIATWLIRISGLLKDQKRPVRDSDKDHLNLLLNIENNKDEILAAMRYHPQMPEMYLTEDIYIEALNKLK